MNPDGTSGETESEMADRLNDELSDFMRKGHRQRPTLPNEKLAYDTDSTFILTKKGERDFLSKQAELQSLLKERFPKSNLEATGGIHEF